jgi:hypothetical protein
MIGNFLLEIFLIGPGCPFYRKRVRNFIFACEMFLILPFIFSEVNSRLFLMIQLYVCVCVYAKEDFLCRNLKSHLKPS